MQFNGFTKKTGSLTNAAVVDDAIRFVEEKSRKFNTSIQVENIESIYGKGHYGKGIILKRILIEKIESSYTVLLLEKPTINSLHLVRLISDLYNWKEIRRLLVICDDVHLSLGEQLFKCFNEMNHGDLNTKFIFATRDDEFKRQRESLDKSDAAEVSIALSELPTYYLTFSLDDATQFLQRALEVTTEKKSEIPSNGMISKVASILYESSKKDPLTFTCFLMAYLGRSCR
jgi:hypothetical protein